MAAEVVSLPPIRLPVAPSPLTPDQKYWATFSSQLLLPAPNSSPVTFISTNSPALQSSHTSSSLGSTSHYLTATTGPRLQLLSPQTLKPVRTIARTSSSFHGACVRRDGRVCIAGSDTGTIQAFDTGSRAILKTWDEHKQPVWVTRWHPRDLTAVMSCSDDTTVRLWDLPAEKSVWTGWGHDDYVRSGAFVGDGNLIATGSYDQSIRLWDTRIGKGGDEETAGSRSCVMTFKLAAPVEAVLPLPGGTTIVGAAGEKLAVLDLVAARPLHLLRNHQKTITSLAVASGGTRVLSGALDGHVKVFETDSWTVVAGFKYPSPVLSLDVVGAGPSAHDRHLCVGMQSGLLSIRTRLSGQAKARKARQAATLDALAAGTIEAHDRKLHKQHRRDRKSGGAGWDRRIRGKDYTGEGADIIVAEGAAPRGRLRNKSGWETALRQGRHARALDLVLELGDGSAVLTLLTALVHRSALRDALEGRTATTLLPVLRWLERNVADARFVRLTCDVCLVLLDVYGEHLGESDEVEQAVERLHQGVRLGAEVAQMCWSTMGMLDLLEAGNGT